jgi:hypothetical protein
VVVLVVAVAVAVMGVVVLVFAPNLDDFFFACLFWIMPLKHCLQPVPRPVAAGSENVMHLWQRKNPQRLQQLTCFVVEQAPQHPADPELKGPGRERDMSVCGVP